MAEVSQYQLVRRIAQGGMAEIYLAKQTAMAGFERIVVIKRVLPELARDREFIESFLNEARHGAQLGHPNIVQTLELGEMQGTYFIALEYIDGVDLATLLRAQRNVRAPLPLAVALRIGCDMLAGLDFAHNAKDTSGAPLGLVHRDISPSNVLVGYGGIAKVVDFGIAKATAKLEGKTKTGLVKGKLSYLAPEQLGKVTIDRRVDVYAAGVVLFEMLTNEHPMRGESELETLQNLAHKEAPLLRTLRPDLSEALEAVLAHALAKDRDARFPSCADFQRALEDAAGTLRLSALSVSAHMESMKSALAAPATADDSDLQQTTNQRIDVSAPALRLAPSITVTAPAPKRAVPLAAITLGLATIAIAVVLALWLRPAPAPMPAAIPAASPAPAPSPSPSPSPSSQPNAPLQGPAARKPRQAPVPAAPALAEPGELKIIVKPWAIVTLDTAELGYSPVPPRSVSAGRHTIVLKNSELGKEIIREIDIPAGGSVTVRVDMMKEH